MQTEILIIGGGIGGCAAALAAAQSGRQVVLTEESDWLGGQFTSQAVPPDEHGGIEYFGCTASYRNFRNRVRKYYRRNYPLTEAVKALKEVSFVKFNETVELPMNGAAWESRLRELIAGSKLQKKVMQVETADFASSFRR